MYSILINYEFKGAFDFAQSPRLTDLQKVVAQLIGIYVLFAPKPCLKIPSYYILQQMRKYLRRLPVASLPYKH